ncbi:hypothetical protein F0U44_20720 [Nocardioides humilatus]|uniref:Uncharacterized protein n=1 Tax=Nocardioides humilatus TaxID=2607660 RepID=A0A5B1L6K8_9ACTN|nr:hypothetical protein [Nocardioides humilatus]KAA1415419.1 hypothetical protein F0U44_20720 [Nocardioides humilatus]
MKLPRWSPRRGNYANITSTAALVIALGAGGAYAANTISSADIIDGEVKTADLGDGSVVTAKLSPSARSTVYTTSHADYLTIGSPPGSSVLSLTVPAAGSYLVTAKAVTASQTLSTNLQAYCTLVAGAHEDVVAATAPASGSAIAIPAIPISAQIVHKFTAGETVDLKCSSGNSTQIGLIRITALRVAAFVTYPG